MALIVWRQIVLNLENTSIVFHHRKLRSVKYCSSFLHIFTIAVQTVRHAGTLGVIKRTMIVLEEGLVSLPCD